MKKGVGIIIIREVNINTSKESGFLMNNRKDVANCLRNENLEIFCHKNGKGFV